jgi:hypothetical protein
MTTKKEVFAPENFMVNINDWESSYGQIVWAKEHNISFWPGYIYDPYLFPDFGDSKFDAKVMKCFSQKTKFLIYFYHSDTFGLVTPRDLFLFRAEDCDKLCFRNKRNGWTNAVLLAKSELEKPIHLRLSWHESPPEKTLSIMKEANSKVTVFFIIC